MSLAASAGDETVRAQMRLVLQLSRLARAVAELREAQRHAAQAAAARQAAEELRAAWRCFYLMVTGGAGQRAHRGRAGPPGLPVPAGPGPARNRAASRRAPLWATSLIPAASTLAARSGPIAGLADTRDSTARKNHQDSATTTACTNCLALGG